MTPKQLKKKQETFKTWRNLFDVRAGLSEDLRKAAIEYGNQQRRVAAGGGVTERSTLFTREITLLQLALAYSQTVQSMEDLRSEAMKLPQNKKVKNARRT